MTGVGGCNLEVKVQSIIKIQDWIWLQSRDLKVRVFLLNELPSLAD